MKTIGLLGGMSRESSAEYYRVMNEAVMARLGGLHSARILMSSVDFDSIRQLMLVEDWQGAGEILASEARKLEHAGADCMLIGTNTMHMVAPQVEAAIDIPLLHIADATADVIRRKGISKVGLLGTRFTTEKPFYRARLESHGIEAVIPCQEDRMVVDEIIFDELCKGHFLEASRVEYVRVIDELVDQGAEAIVFGCTEIGLLVRPEFSQVPVFDTCHIHAEAAVDFAMGSDYRKNR